MHIEVTKKITLELKQAIGVQDPCTLCVFNTDLCFEDEIDFPIEFSECGDYGYWAFVD